MSSTFDFVVIYFVYGLSFFSMGLLIVLEGNQASDLRLRKALRPLAGFGIVHGVHEWVEMFEKIASLMGDSKPLIPEYIRLALLAVSFVSLIAFGTYLLAYTEKAQRLVTLVPIGIETIWVLGLFTFIQQYPADEIWGVADVWTRYVLAIPGGLLAAIGLVAQQRAFRHSGLVRFGQDALWAAIAFVWYGVIGQFFVRTTNFSFSSTINQDLFLSLFGFPVQLFRSIMALAIAFFVVRFLRAFRTETELKIKELRGERLEEAQQKEALKGELYRRIVEAQEAERHRIARDLHDETGQALTAIGMGLRGVSTSLGNNRDREQTLSTLRNLEALTDGSLLELQRLIADLRPSHLDDLGLPATIRWYASDVMGRTNLKVETFISGEEKVICPEYSTSIFRILQEALTNVIKHADATWAHINIVFETEVVRISVEDNGRGFDTERHLKEKSWGLIGMQERTTLLDGQFLLRSRPEQGTILEIIIPYCPIHTEVINL
ncbi:MAG: sensor histidine kinase [Chloroflexi bacterium]|nr:sensor histidine kinase [Chloroflexota bacterium]